MNNKAKIIMTKRIVKYSKPELKTLLNEVKNLCSTGSSASIGDTGSCETGTSPGYVCSSGGCAHTRYNSSTNGPCSVGNYAVNSASSSYNPIGCKTGGTASSLSALNSCDGGTSPGATGGCVTGAGPL